MVWPIRVLWVLTGRTQSRGQTLTPRKTPASSTTSVLGSTNFRFLYNKPERLSWRSTELWCDTNLRPALQEGPAGAALEAAVTEAQAACPEVAAPAASCLLALLTSYTNYFV